MPFRNFRISPPHYKYAYTYSHALVISFGRCYACQMNDFLDSPLLGSMAKALATDIASVSQTALFPCRPIMASTAGNRTVLGRFSGTISLRNSLEFRHALDDLAASYPQKVILDLATAALSKTGVGILVSFAADGHGRGSFLYLYRPSAQIRAVIKELNLSPFFSVLETEEDLMASVLL
jgi:hypothetical protein